MARDFRRREQYAKNFNKRESACIVGELAFLSAFPPPSLFHHHRHLLLLLLLREEVEIVNTVLESCTIYKSAPVPHHRCIAGTINRHVYCRGSRRRRVWDQQFMKTKNKSVFVLLFFFFCFRTTWRFIFSNRIFSGKLGINLVWQIYFYNCKAFFIIVTSLYLSIIKVYSKIGDELMEKNCNT